MLSRVCSATVIGIDACAIFVEVDVSNGLPGTHIVGLPDAGVKEGRLRIRGALENAGFKMPQRRITVNLAPADLRKDGAAFDLPIALGVLVAAGGLPADALDDALFVGELALDGAVRSVKGVLPMAAWARARGLRRMFVPADNAAEARAAGGPEVVAVKSLPLLVDALRSGGMAAPDSVPEAASLLAGTPPDLADIRGQEVARRALEIAAAGGHNLLLVGPPGSGKTMLARRLPGILPAPTFDEALETSMIYSVAGLLGGRSLVPERPFRAPHHTVTSAGLVGGGPMVRPGEISLAHNGVLFLDELLEFSRPALEALRQPLEERFISVVRARRALRFPADFMLIAALNPCPCGHLGNALRTCTCSEAGIHQYRGKLSGPLLDRIDMHVDVPALCYRALSGGEPGEPSRSVRARVEQARARQMVRGPRWNARLDPTELRLLVRPDGDGHRILERAVEKLALSARALDRLRRVARTIADLEGSQPVAAAHFAEALQYRVLDRPIGS